MAEEKKYLLRVQGRLVEVTKEVMEGLQFRALWRTAGYRTAAPPGPRIPPVSPWAGRSPPRQISAARGPSIQPPGCFQAACGTLGSRPRADTR